jgi:CheY-like chemotaxis protein
MEVVYAPPALVLLDVRMPNLHGAVVCQNIRAALPTLPIVLMTATPGEAHALVAEGAADGVAERQLCSRS